MQIPTLTERQRAKTVELPVVNPVDLEPASARAKTRNIRGGRMSTVDEKFDTSTPASTPEEIFSSDAERLSYAIAAAELAIDLLEQYEIMPGMVARIRHDIAKIKASRGGAR